MTRRLDAIFFDIDDTLFSTSVFADKAAPGRSRRDARGQGYAPNREAMCFKELTEVIVQEFSSATTSSHLDKLDRAPAALRPARGSTSEILVAAGVAAYHETKWRELQVYDDVYEVLRWLAEKDLLRGIISAGRTIKQAEKLIRLRIYEFLTPHAIFFTEQIGISKPNPKLYRRAANDLGLDPTRCMYVGDNPTHDIAPAKAEGFIAVRSQRSGRYSSATNEVEPDYTIHDFYGLRELLKRDFEL